MTVCVNNQYRLATWDHDLAGAGSLTDEHRKKTIHGDNDWICAHFQRDPQRKIWNQKRKLNVNSNQIWKAVWATMPVFCLWDQLSADLLKYCLLLQFPNIFFSWILGGPTLYVLSPVSKSIIRRRNSLFGHVTRLAEDTPAHQALRCHVDMTLGRLPDHSWRRHPGCPRNRPALWRQQLLACWPLEMSLITWTFGGDATVLADYALTTTTTTNVE